MACTDNYKSMLFRNSRKDVTHNKISQKIQQKKIQNQRIGIVSKTRGSNTTNNNTHLEGAVDGRVDLALGSATLEDVLLGTLELFLSEGESLFKLSNNNKKIKITRTIINSCTRTNTYHLFVKMISV